MFFVRFMVEDHIFLWEGVSLVTQLLRVSLSSLEFFIRFCCVDTTLTYFLRTK